MDNQTSHVRSGVNVGVSGRQARQASASRVASHKDMGGDHLGMKEGAPRLFVMREGISIQHQERSKETQRKIQRVTHQPKMSCAEMLHQREIKIMKDSPYVAGIRELGNANGKRESDRPTRIASPSHKSSPPKPSPSACAHSRHSKAYSPTPNVVMGVEKSPSQSKSRAMLNFNLTQRESALDVEQSNRLQPHRVNGVTEVENKHSASSQRGAVNLNVKPTRLPVLLTTMECNALPPVPTIQQLQTNYADARKAEVQKHSLLHVLQSDILAEVARFRWDSDAVPNHS